MLLTFIGYATLRWGEGITIALKLEIFSSFLSMIVTRWIIKNYIMRTCIHSIKQRRRPCKVNVSIILFIYNVCSLIDY